ncbi:MAG: hypothetical protein ACKVTZ_00360 [Bacteroidia bacterium]
MEPKISKAQLEVWEWKEKAYEATKDMTMQERLAYINEHTKAIIEKFGKTRTLNRRNTSLQEPAHP